MDTGDIALQRLMPRPVVYPEWLHKQKDPGAQLTAQKTVANGCPKVILWVEQKLS